MVTSIFSFSSASVGLRPLTSTDQGFAHPLETCVLQIPSFVQSKNPYIIACVAVYVGYIYSNGVSELVLGACMGLAGLTGILGTFLFTRLRKRLGLERTGVIAFTAQASCLTLAVASVWAPGSPFDPHFTSRSPHVVCNDSSLLSSSNYTESNVTNVDGQSEVTLCDSSDELHGVNVSVVLLLVGIILSRVGKHRCYIVTFCYFSLCFTLAARIY